MNQRKSKQIRKETEKATEIYLRVNSKLPRKGLYRRLYGNAKKAYNQLPRTERKHFTVV